MFAPNPKITNRQKPVHPNAASVVCPLVHSESDGGVIEEAQITAYPTNAINKPPAKLGSCFVRATPFVRRSYQPRCLSLHFRLK